MPACASLFCLRVARCHLLWSLTLMKVALLLLIKGYRQFVSPLFPPVCRFEPTCSCYAIEAIDRFGPLKGSWLAAGRITRCHPFNPGGYDPVPLEPTPSKGNESD